MDENTPTDVAVDEAWLGWNSGSLFADSLGEDAVDLSFGRQDFDLGSGFLIWEGATNGGNRGAYWLAPREAFEMTGIAKLETHGFIGRAFYLEPDDDPDTETKLLGLDVEYALAEGGCAADAYPINCVGAGLLQHRQLRHRHARRDERLRRAGRHPATDVPVGPAAGRRVRLREERQRSRGLWLVRRDRLRGRRPALVTLSELPLRFLFG